MRTSIRTTIFFATLFILFFTTNVFAQQVPPVKNSMTRIIDKALTDSGLVKKRIRFNEYTYAPGYADTVSHRHAAEVFIYVIEGTLEHRLGNSEPIIYKKGQVLHEPPYALHSLTKNASTTEPLKLLITFLYTDAPNAPRTIREYPAKKK